MRSSLKALLSGGMLICSALAHSAFAAPVSLTTEAIEYFNIGFSDNSAGKLTFLGGLEIASEEADFGGFSGLRLSGDGTRLFSVSDAGFWFTAEIIRSPGRAMKSLVDSDLSCLCKADGTPYPSKRWADAEGLEIHGKRAYVSFERLNRINVYDLKNDYFPGPPVQATASFKPFSISANKGLEAMALAPATSPLAGKFVAIAEEDLDANGNNRAFIADAKSITEFSITRSDDYSVTDASFLPDGDLLILERRIGLSIGVGMRIRRIKSADLAPGRTADGEILMEAGLTSRIDNMEGIATWQTPEGETRIAVISDDNFNRRLQRTLLLEFRLEE